VIWLVIAVIAASAAMTFFVFAAFLWLAEEYGPLIASLAMGCVFILVALIALIACLLARRRNIERARLELAARNNAASWLDPKLMGVVFQIGQSIGWRRIATLAAVGVLAAGLAKEWSGREESPPEGDDPPSES
jgi:hypothetical protein